MSNLIINAEGLPELAARVQREMPVMYRATVGYLLVACDGPAKPSDVGEGARYFEDVAVTDRARDKIASLANVFCAEAEIEPPLFAKDKKRIVTATGRALHYILVDSSLDGQTAASCAELEQYIRDGILAEQTVFSAHACNAVFEHLRDRHHDPADFLVLDDAAIRRLTTVHSTVHSRPQITIDAAITEAVGKNMEGSGKSIKPKTEKKPANPTKELTKKYPGDRALIKQFFDFMCMAGVNPAEEVWEVLESSDGSLASELVGLALSQPNRDMLADTRIGLVADSCGVKVPKRQK